MLGVRPVEEGQPRWSVPLPLSPLPMAGLPGEQGPTCWSGRRNRPGAARPAGLEALNSVEVVRMTLWFVPPLVIAHRTAGTDQVVRAGDRADNVAGGRGV